MASSRSKLHRRRHYKCAGSPTCKGNGAHWHARTLLGYSKPVWELYCHKCIQQFKPLDDCLAGEMVKHLF